METNEIKWYPKLGEPFWVIGTLCRPVKRIYYCTNMDNYFVSMGNCFKSEEDCLHACNILTKNDGE